MPVLTKINTNSIAEDAITGDKFAGDAYLANTANQNISGTYSENKLYTSDAYTLSGNATVNSHLTLSSVKPTADVVLTAGGAYTITGTGVLSAGSLLAKERSDLTGMTGELGSTVTGTPAITEAPALIGLGTVTSGTLGSEVTIPRGANGVATVQVKKTSSQTSVATSENSASLCTFDTVLLNVGNAWNSGAHHFSAPRAGIYRFGYGGASSSGNNTVFRMYFWLNGSKHVDGQLRIDAPGTEYTWGSRDALISLSAGDVIDIRISIDSSTTTWYADQNLQTYFNIEFLG